MSISISKHGLPTMYDLPSEDLKESGLPDEFHDLQPQLLSRTLRLANYQSDRYFTGTDMNLYYDPDHPRWHKRPDWFLVLDVPRLYQQQDLRNSYVVWDEGRSPSVIVELLSPGRESEDLGDFVDELIEANNLSPNLPQSIEDDETGIKPPHKLQVYGQILQVPYYFVFSRYTNRLRFFQLMGEQYQEQRLDRENPKVWLSQLEIGLGIWYGEFDGITRSWLRWYDSNGNWMPTDAEALQTRLLQGGRNLLAAGMSIEQVSQILGLSEAEIRSL